jgi:hypothetical protein
VNAGHIAVDGKTLKGSRRLDAKPLHVLSAFATEPSSPGMRSSASATSVGTSAMRMGIICSPELKARIAESFGDPHLSPWPFTVSSACPGCSTPALRPLRPHEAETRPKACRRLLEITLRRGKEYRERLYSTTC